MSKNRKTLFSSPSDTQGVVKKIEPEVQEGNSQLIESSSAIKRELGLVLGIVIAISLAFGAIYITDRQYNWVESTSEKIAKAVIKSY